jgi:hypothetical protein
MTTPNSNRKGRRAKRRKVSRPVVTVCLWVVIAEVVVPNLVHRRICPHCDVLGSVGVAHYNAQ